MRLFISAGEPSGDLHGANLAEVLSHRLPGVVIDGFGGNRMKEAGVNLLYPLTELSAMWFTQTLRNLDKYIHLGVMAESYFRTKRPDAVVLIDYPGFHWHIALRAKRYGIPVYYFVPPQLWAWAGWRVHKMRRNFKTVLTALPFEDDWYRERNVPTHYVGHPYFDEIAEQKLDPEFLAAERAKPGEIVALLPGSRTQEVTFNFPMMVKAAKIVAAKRPGVRFLVASFKEKQAVMAREMLRDSGLNADIHICRTPEIIELGTICVAVSGSVSLELLSRLKPTIVVYKMNRRFRFIAGFLIRVKYISLVNLLLDRGLFPEYPTASDESKAIAGDMLNWLEHPEKLAEVREELRKLRDQVAKPGAVERAAEFLIGELVSSAVLSPSPAKGEGS